MTRFYRQGDKSTAVCEACEAIVPTTFRYRDVPYDDGSGVAKDILAAQCDQCDMVVGIPAQSTVAIARQRETADVPLEVKVPAVEVELLDFAAHRIDALATKRFRKSLFAFFINELAGQPAALHGLGHDVSRWLSRWKASGTANKVRRISMKLAPQTEERVRAIMKATGLDRTGVMHAVIMRVERDILDEPVPAKIDELRRIARVVNA